VGLGIRRGFCLHIRVNYNWFMSTSLPISGDAMGDGDRRHWPGRKGKLSELEADEQDLSATTTVEERFAMMWQLARMPGPSAESQFLSQSLAGISLT
jgi:hypothetical protein